MRQRCACLGLTVLAPWALAAADIEDARDPPGLARFPDSRIVAYSEGDERRSYEFVTGRVDRRGRDLHIDSSSRVVARLLRVTYQAPEGTRLDDVVDHYRALVAGQQADVAFECRGRDCGRSTAWANGVFGVKELVAPDASQFYLAASFGESLAAIYAVQRGNRRIYAHVDLVRDVANRSDGSGSSVAGAASGDLMETLLRRGFVVLPIAPDVAGELDVAALAALEETGAELAAIGGRSLYVVCHLGDDVANARTLSEVCADRAAKRLQRTGVNAEPFGAGALLPRPGMAARRLELVLPGVRR